MEIFMKAAVEVSDPREINSPELMDWREYQKTPRGSVYYPSLYSLQWHIRKNRKALIEGGALIKMRGRDYIVIEPFEKSIVRIGSAEAYKKFK
jgi:hypothetical protein